METRKLCYPRDARYISRSWAVAEIWPFQIIQDGGGRHLEFVRIENSAIRDPPCTKTPHYTKHVPSFLYNPANYERYISQFTAVDLV